SPAVPARTVVTLTPSPEGGTPSETYQPVIEPTPIVTKPLAGHVPLTVKPTDTIPSPSPFSPNPFSPNPFSPNPFSPNPFSPNPFSPNPFSPNAFPSEFSNATFYVKPSQPGSGTVQANSALAKYVADPSPDVMVATIRDFLITG